MVKQRSIDLGELPPPFSIKYHKVNEVIQYGDDNAYPTRMERIVNGSITAKSCADMFARFMVGYGFVDETLNNIIVGTDEYYRPITAYKLLNQIAKSLSRFNGIYVRGRFDGNGETIGLSHVPFKYCRFGEPDSSDYSGKIIIYNDWDRYRSSGKFAKTDKDKFITVDVWNPVTVKSQMEKHGSKYKGQVYFNFLDDEYVYPVSPVDPVLFDADTENQISKFKNGEIRRGFFLKYVIQHAKFEDPREQEKFKDMIKKMMGGGHDVSHLLIEGEYDKETGNLKENAVIRIDPVEQKIIPALFNSYEESCINNIRKAFNGIPQMLIDYENGKLGTTSGEAIIQAVNFYNTQTEGNRAFIQDTFTELFKNWKDKSLREKNFEIKPLTFNGITLDNNGSTGDQTD